MAENCTGESSMANDKKKKNEKLFFEVEDIPDWATTILFGIQVRFAQI